MPKWTFLTNHALVLSSIAKQPRITAREISVTIGITERAVRKIIADLDAAEYISKKKEGRRIMYRINHDLSLRHGTYQEVAVGDFLEALGCGRMPKRTHTPKVDNKELQAAANHDH
ncbi:MAG: helix-turn-helix domain-containing protein [Candidatus Bathyarchaeota archaeon]|nr:helix-turn-helix domain-containing protein [Candidatus Bathyarchaeota archaeon]